MDIFSVFTLLGGLAFFLYGMNIMGEALERKAGTQLKSILENFTSNTFKGFLLGLVVTAIIQSSSATTVMVVGFVNSGIMTLHQAVGVIFGANIGTSVTSWLLSLADIDGSSILLQMLKPSSFTPILAFIGIVLIMVSKKSSHKDTAMILIGFAVLMFGMETMSGAVEPLAESEKFREVLVMFSNPVLGLIVGALFTAIIQSSSASVGVLQALSSTGAVTYSSAIPIIMGQNIGTCVSAIISSVGASKNAKRAAVIHLCFNCISAVVLLSLYCAADAVFSFEFADDSIDKAGIALIHTSFNILAVCMLMPFSRFLEKLACAIVKDDKNPNKQELLDERLFTNSTIAVDRCRKVTCEMADVAVSAVSQAITLINKYDEETAAQVKEKEERVDVYEDKLGSYLVKLNAMGLTEEDNNIVSKLLHVIGDFERISDHALNVLDAAREMHDKNIHFSEEALQELTVIEDAVIEILNTAVKAFEDNNLNLAASVEPLEEVIDGLRMELKARHIQRLQSDKCTIELGFIFSDLLTNLERISDHCSNIAVCIIQISKNTFDTHEYLSELKNSDADFRKQCEFFVGKYSLKSGK